jgi:hypothetical protein
MRITFLVIKIQISKLIIKKYNFYIIPYTAGLSLFKLEKNIYIYIEIDLSIEPGNKLITKYCNINFHLKLVV